MSSVNSAPQPPTQGHCEVSRRPPAKVLIVDDMEDVRWALSSVVRLAGCEPVLAANGQEALELFLQERPAVVLLDVGLPDIDGFEVLKRIKAHDKSASVVMVTAHGKTRDAVRAIQCGAYDYVAKPFLNQDIVLTVRHILEEDALKIQKRQLAIGTESSYPLSEIMGPSAVIARIQREVDRVAITPLSVLLLGESGTGKEVLARAIYAGSSRADKPFIALDCGAIPATLIENELFGHEKGAYTGAHQAQVGAFEMAAGGTLFLDEIGNLPLAVQGTLLRVLEVQRIRKIGSSREQKIDFRLVAASNMSLQDAIEQKTFRGDLYYRLAEFTIHLPALRERSEDIAFLARRFLAEANLGLGKQVTGLSAQTDALLQGYAWPGNVRELRNQVRRAVLLCTEPDGELTPELFGMLDSDHSQVLGMRDQLPALRTIRSDPVQTPRSYPSPDGQETICVIPNASLSFSEGLSLKEIVARVTHQIERLVLTQTLRIARGNKAEAARLLKIDYKTMHTKLKLYGISSNAHNEDSCKQPDREA